MKKYVSVFGLWAAMTFWPCAAVWVFMTAAELIFAFVKLPSGAASFGYWRFSEFIGTLGPGKVYGIAMALMCLALYLPCRNASRLRLARLAVGERAAAAAQAACGLCWLLAMWAAQLGVFCVILLRYLALLGVKATALDMLVNAYQTPLFHWMLPLRDWQVCLIMALIELGLALNVAGDCLYARARGGFPVWSIVTGFAAAMCVGRRVDSEGWFGIALCALTVGVGVVRLWTYKETEA